MKDSIKFALGLLASMLLIALSTFLLTADRIGVGVFIVLIIASIGVLIIPMLFFKGNVIVLDGTSLRIEAPMVNVNLPFDSIDTVRIYERVSFGIRTFGFTGISNRSGDFTNSEFGTYICACNTKVPLYIFVKSGKKKVLFNLSTMESTRSAFDMLCSRVSCEVNSEPYIMTEEEKIATSRRKKMIIGISVAITCIVFVIVAFVTLTGSVNVTLTDKEVDVDASFTFDYTIPYSDIKRIELRKNIDYGTRVVGTSNFKVLTGTFNNDEFGKYTLAVNRSVPECIVIHTDDKTYVVNCTSSESTVNTYNELSRSYRSYQSICTPVYWDITDNGVCA